MADQSVVTSIVLAGGGGKRFGRDKLSERIGDRTLLQRVISCLGQLSSHILVVIAQRQTKPHLSSFSAEVIVDLYPDTSALGGIYTGLLASRSFHSLVVAADMPFLNSPLLAYMLETASDCDVVIPRINGNLEPLHAVYSKKCLIPMQQQIEQGELQVRRLLEQVRVKYVEEAEIDRFDPKHLSFFNINTVADLRRAREMLGESGGP